MKTLFSQAVAPRIDCAEKGASCWRTALGAVLFLGYSSSSES